MLLLLSETICCHAFAILDIAHTIHGLALVLDAPYAHDFRQFLECFTHITSIQVRHQLLQQRFVAYFLLKYRPFLGMLSF